LYPSSSHLKSQLEAGGIRRRKITEICGGPGTGKTQLATQLCADATIPKAFGGAGGSAIYVDCDGSFSVGRLTELAEALTAHVRKLAVKKHRSSGVLKTTTSRDDDGTSGATATCLHEEYDVAHVLRKVSRARVLDDLDVVAAVEVILDRLVAAAVKEEDVVLVVIDSLASHFRWFRPEADKDARSRLLARVAVDLATLAIRFDVAVVVVNQLTTRNDQQTAPALGAHWSHVPDCRLLLEKHDDGRRTCKVLKGFLPDDPTVDFTIDHRGIRDKNTQHTPTTTTA